MTDQKEKYQRQLDMLSEISIHLQDLVLSKNIYKQILENIQSCFHYYHISLWTVDKNEVPSLAANDGAYEHKLIPGFQMEDEGIINYVIQTKKPYLCNDTTNDPNFSSLNLPTETQSSLSVPVFSPKKELYAILNIESAMKEAFNKDDLHVMESVAALVSLALNNVFLYNEVRDFNKQLKSKIQEKTKELQKAKERILAQQQMLKKENRALKTIVTKSIDEKGEILGESIAIKSLLSMIDKIAPTLITVLIQGESGTGKELLARRIHKKSDRPNKPFLMINCAALQDSLLESELFGHEKNTFEDPSQKIGLLETADEGTLFLDNVEEISLPIQAKLLRTIQEGEIYRIGGKKNIKVNVRIISATHQDLEQEVKTGHFREDLFYRLDMITLRVPPLRERLEDVPILLEHFLKKSDLVTTRKTLKIDERSLQTLKNYPWPGNVRELQNVVERLKILTTDDTIYPENLPFNIRMPKKFSEEKKPGGTVIMDNIKQMRLEELEKNHILQMLNYQFGNKTKTAKTLGITVKTLYNKLHHYGLLSKNNNKESSSNNRLK